MSYVEWKEQHKEELKLRWELSHRERKAEPIAAFSSDSIEYLNAMEDWLTVADQDEKDGNYFGADSVRSEVYGQLRDDGFNPDQLYAMGWAF